jgi:hypothetical protein
VSETATSTVVNFPGVAQGHYDDEKNVVGDGVDDAVIADPNA